MDRPFSIQFQCGRRAPPDRSPYPVVLFHGNGQTGVDWQQTADNRPGWAYRLIEAGYAVYMVDYPARGRSAYVPLPGPDGKTPIERGDRRLTGGWNRQSGKHSGNACRCN